MTLKDLLTVDDVARSAHLQSLSKATGEKALLIPDYISKPKGSIDDEEDLINFSSMGSQAHLVLRSKTKPRVDQVTLAMWVSANARILQTLVDRESDISSTSLQSLLKSYLEYTAEVGDLCQSYTTQSVMLMDDSHRRQQAKEGTAWADVRALCIRRGARVRGGA